MSAPSTFRTFSRLLALGLTLSGCSSLPLEGPASEQDAGPVPFQKIVEFDRPVHFMSPNGQDTLIAPGGYTVEIVQEGLRLTSTDRAGAEPLVIQSQPITHQESVPVAEPVSVSGGDDQQVVMMLLPGGKAQQAIGTLSGVFSRGHPHIKVQPGFLGSSAAATLPVITSLLATPPPPPYGLPPLGSIAPEGTLYIKGNNLSNTQGKVILLVQVPVQAYFDSPPGVVSTPGSQPGTRKVQLQVQQWSADKIIAKMPLVSGVPDHLATLQVLNGQGIGTPGWKVPFFAERQSKVLAATDPAVKVVHCSTEGDYNKCNSLDTSTGGSCFAKGIIPVIKTTTFYAWHVNCDLVVDWDKGFDSFDVTLKNGWVFKKVEYIHDESSGSEKIIFGDYAALRHNLPGKSSWKPQIYWEVSPGPDQLQYGFWLTIEGPKGFPYY